LPKNLKENRLQRLKDLADSPQEQLLYARSLLESERDRQTLTAALGILREFPAPENRPGLLKLYQYYLENSSKRDPGMYLRAAVLRALRPLTRQADLPLLEQAALTYELMPSRHDAEGAELRALALSILNDLDEVRASYYAVKLLVDPVTSEMSGEPALTAAKILAAQNLALPLYEYLVSASEKSPEVAAACLRGLDDLPETLLAKLVGLYRFSSSEVILLGLFDLLLTHPQGKSFSEVFSDFLAATGSFNLYRYVALALITSGKAALLTGFLERVKSEKDSLKQEIILELLPLIQGNTHKAEVAFVQAKFGKA
jgi:hypothetical protein